MKKLILPLFIFLNSNSFVMGLQPLLNTDDTDHRGTDWIISASTTIAGMHKNIGDFRILPGITVSVVATTVTASPWTNSRYGSVQIYANSIHIDGLLTADGAGYGTGPCDVNVYDGLGPGAGQGSYFGSGGGGHGGRGGNGSGGLGGKSDITENGNLWFNTDDNLYLNAKDASGQVIVSGAGKLTFASVTAGLNPTLELASSGKSAAGRRNWSGMWAANNTMYLTGHQAGGIVAQLNSEYNPAFTVDGTDALDGKGVVGATLRLGADQTDYTALTTWFVANQDLVAGDVVMVVTSSAVNGSRRVTKVTAAGDDFVGVVVRDASAGAAVEVAIAGIVKVKHAIAGEVRANQGEAVILSDATDGGVMDGETAANVVGIALEDGTVGGKVTVLLSGPTQN